MKKYFLFFIKTVSLIKNSLSTKTLNSMTLKATPLGLVTVFALTILNFNTVSANEIIEVRRNITLHNDEVPFKDYYIKSDNTSAYKKNMVVKAVRTIAVKDASQKVVGQFKTPVGLLKVIQTSENIIVARELKLIPRDSEAMLEQIGVMTGDEIDLKDSYIDSGKTK